MPNAPPLLHLTMSAAPAEVGRALDEVRRFLTEQHASEEVIDDLCLVVDEVLANIMSHGYGKDANGSMNLVLSVVADDYSLEVRDRAPAFNPLDAAPPDLGDDPDERAIGGLGMHLVRSLMSEITYERSGAENVLRLRRGR